MRYISLFSGIGALDLAVRSVLGAETEAYVEIDGFCQKVLRARMKDGYLEEAEIFDDIRKFKWEKTDMVVGGFPCQPFSVAGERKGESDDRNMWPDTLRVIRMARPKYVFLENVPGLLSGDGEGRQPYVYTVLRDLAEEGFDAEWEIVGADDAGSSHRRKRWFCFAYRKLADTEDRGRNQKGWDRGKILSEEARNWPTPRVSDTEGGTVKNVEMHNGQFSRLNLKGERWSVKLRDVVESGVWPTPTTQETVHSQTTHRDPQTHPDGSTCSVSCRRLNPLFVEYLMMGKWLIGWTDLKPLGTQSHGRQELSLSDSVSKGQES